MLFTPNLIAQLVAASATTSTTHLWFCLADTHVSYLTWHKLQVVFERVITDLVYMQSVQTAYVAISAISKAKPDVHNVDLYVMSGT